MVCFWASLTEQVPSKPLLVIYMPEPVLPQESKCEQEAHCPSYLDVSPTKE